MKTMCPPGYYHNELVVAHALGHMLYMTGLTQHHVPKCMNCHKAIAVITGRAYCLYDYILCTFSINKRKMWEDFLKASKTSFSKK